MSQNSKIHDLSVIDPSAKLGKNNEIGPFCTVGPNVQLGDNVKLVSHVVVDGVTTIGADTIIFPFASIGTIPQDLKFSGEESTLVIGKRNRIREHVTMNPGTKGDNLTTIVGDDCLFMMGSHVAHDCVVGNNVILANNATLAGHVHVGDYAIIGGLSAIHQFARIGEHAMIGGMSGVENDVIPYGMVMGERARLAGLNLVGLERRGFAKQQVQDLMKAFRNLFMGEGTFADRLKSLEAQYANDELVMDMIMFAKAEASRPLCQPKK
jgi:UDP-N-acetylglucosamine acyltransferase